MSLRFDRMDDDPNVASTFAAHRGLVEINPFNDGDGRTARLLMNLLLIRSGYAPVTVRPVDRSADIDALQSAQAGRGTDAFDRLLGGGARRDAVRF